MRVRRFDFAPGDLSQEGGDTATFGVSKLALGAAPYVGGRPRSGCRGLLLVGSSMSGLR